MGQERIHFFQVQVWIHRHRLGKFIGYFTVYFCYPAKAAVFVFLPLPQWRGIVASDFHNESSFKMLMFKMYLY